MKSRAISPPRRVLPVVETPETFAHALTSGQPFTVKGLAGRLLRGKGPENFQTLTPTGREPSVFVMGKQGLQHAAGHSGYDLLMRLGLSPEDVKRFVVDEGNRFKLAVFKQGETVQATWDNAVRMAERAYPGVGELLNPHLGTFRTQPFEALENQFGHSMSAADQAGPEDPHFMTVERFLSSDQTAGDARAFLFHTFHLRELFAGDGFTRTADGKRGVDEFLAINRPLFRLGDVAVIDVPVSKRQVLQQAP